MRWNRLLLTFAVAFTTSPMTAAQPDAPIVTMRVTPGGGPAQEVMASESGVARLWFDGIEYAVRPTILDAAPWTRFVITIFRTATNAAPSQVVSEMELTRGEAGESHTNPSFRIEVLRVDSPSVSSASSLDASHNCSINSTTETLAEEGRHLSVIRTGAVGTVAPSASPEQGCG